MKTVLESGYSPRPKVDIKTPLKSRIRIGLLGISLAAAYVLSACGNGVCDESLLKEQGKCNVPVGSAAPTGTLNPDNAGIQQYDIAEQDLKLRDYVLSHPVVNGDGWDLVEADAQACLNYPHADSHVATNGIPEKEIICPEDELGPETGVCTAIRQGLGRDESGYIFYGVYFNQHGGTLYVTLLRDDLRTFDDKILDQISKWPNQPEQTIRVQVVQQGVVHGDYCIAGSQESYPYWEAWSDYEPSTQPAD